MSAIKSQDPVSLTEQPYCFRYQGLSIHWEECLGRGHYGNVYKAECDFLPCAAKVLERHPESNTISANIDKLRLQLNYIRHPNIVQYLDIIVDPEHVSSSPVLLMELLDESLTQMLGRLQQPLALHIQLDLCHDIALAVAYLHNQNIIHRDLCSNNVLLIAGRKAKVADFGMFGLNIANAADVSQILTSLNVRPATSLDYMPPEALNEPLNSPTKKIDCYSEGVIMMQVCTNLQEPKQNERRKHLDQIDSTHPLLPLIRKCLSDHEDDRPSAADLCCCLAELKKQCSDNRVEVDIPLGVQQISEESKTRTSEQTQNSLTSAPVIMEEEGDHTPHLDHPRLAEQAAALPEQSWEPGEPISAEKMIRGAVALDGDEAYFMNENGEIWLYDSADRQPWSKVNNNYGRSRQHSSLVIVKGLLTVIGGLDDRGLANVISNTLLSLMGDDADTKEWKEHFPPMPTARYYAAAVTTSQHLIVAGGIGEERLSRFLPRNLTKDVNLSNVEVMNTDTLVWSTVAALPHPYCKTSATICRGKLYLLGGEDTKSKSCSVLACSVAMLVQSNRDTEGLWKVLKNQPPNFYCTGANVDGNLITVGGKKNTAKNEVYKYDPDRGNWKRITNTPTARYKCLVATFPSKKMVVVVGGQEDSKRLCTATEIWQYE